MQRAVVPAVAGVCAYAFIVCVLRLVGRLEHRQYPDSRAQCILLGCMVSFVVLFLYGVLPSRLPADVCSMAFLFTIAVIDELTGYVYDCFGIYAVVCSGMTVLLHGIPRLGSRELLLMGIYLAAVFLSAALKGLGAGDVPVYLALMLYYLRYVSFPAQAAVFLLLLSQLLFGISALIQRKRHLPLVPYICMAHYVTLCLW